jgi:hypothetical protein
MMILISIKYSFELLIEQEEFKHFSIDHCWITPIDCAKWNWRVELIEKSWLQEISDGAVIQGIIGEREIMGFEQSNIE